MTAQKKKPIPAYVGTALTRSIACTAALAADVWLYWKFKNTIPISHLMFLLALLVNIAAMVFSFKSMFVRWTRFGEIMQEGIGVLIFSTCYLLIVPFFTLLKKLAEWFEKSSHSGGNSYWKDRKILKIDLQYLSRMG